MSASQRQAGRGRPRVVVGIFGVLAVTALALAALAFLWSRPSIVADAAALARVELPLTEGTIENVQATGPLGRPIPIAFSDGRLWPQVKLAPGEPVSVEVTLRRPGWIAWLAGSRYNERLSLRTPSAALRARYLTLASGAPLQLAFDAPVRAIAYGQAEHLHVRVFAEPHADITLGNAGEAGSIEVAAAPRTWESLPAPALLSWFPSGAHATAVVSPRPGTRITPATPISITFSQPVSAALGGAQPRLQPAAAGSWRELDERTLEFVPHGFGYGLDTPVTLGLPHTVRLIGGHSSSSASVAAWTVPPGSNLRAQQLLALLGYLPLRFKAARHVARTAAAQERAAVAPPPGTFSWRYRSTPPALQALWRPGSESVVLRGAVMAFENAHELTTDGLLGPAVWHALIDAELHRERARAGYTFVMVSESSQSLALWHDGSIRIATPVNTGIASAPTELGTFPVYEHVASGTMSGTNPDGTHYEDPGVPWISYFNGGDALHGFERAQYGFPQSLGCVEMPPSTAGEVWPYTPIGTLVHVD